MFKFIFLTTGSLRYYQIELFFFFFFFSFYKENVFRHFEYYAVF